MAVHQHEARLVAVAAKKGDLRDDAARPVSHHRHLRAQVVMEGAIAVAHGPARGHAHVQAVAAVGLGADGLMLIGKRNEFALERLVVRKPAGTQHHCAAHVDGHFLAVALYDDACYPAIAHDQAARGRGWPQCNAGVEPAR
jgi:hypothetical protein